MPNWSTVAYKIDGDKQTVQKIYDAINNMKPSERASEDWLGNILETLGIEFKLGNMRGFIDGPAEFDENVLRIWSYEAWGRTDFAEYLKRGLPQINVYWVAEEPGFEIYQTNDIDGWHFPDRYKVSAYINNEYFDEYFVEAEEVYDYVRDTFHLKSQKEIDAFNEENKESGCYIYIHEFEVVGGNELS